MARERNRIYFSAGNPWPEGHAIERAWLDANLRGDGLYLFLQLTTAKYRDNDGGGLVDDDSDSDSDSDWGSKLLWNNYHSARIGGILLFGERGKPIALSSLPGARFVIDPLPESHDKLQDDELSFEIYLLGHDSVADHHITFGQLGAEGYDVHWTGKIALTYSGASEFEHGFEVTLDVAPLDEIAVSSDFSPEAARAFLPQVLAEHADFGLTERNGKHYFVRRFN